jgi:hypothetical protein
MAQKTNLNVSPYFDDFNEPNIGGKDNNYYKVLFKPGRPIQARELNTLQSILQDQVESFGSHIFKEGSLVIPGNITYDDSLFAVKLNSTQSGIDLSLYLSELVGKTITGNSSGITATVKLVQLSNNEIEYPTIYVKYINSNNDFELAQFEDNEQLITSELVTYGGNTIAANTVFATTINSESTSIGSAASIGEGVYFVRGSFVRVEKQTIILDYYTNTPSYRVGLKVTEKIITAKDDFYLYDNAKGFNNYAAPGADRFKIDLTLTKKLITDKNDTDFIELLRLKDGAIKKIDVRTSYNIIRDYLAQRTYDESGDYTVNPFEISLNNSLNNYLGNNGIFSQGETTEKGNTPSDDLMCIKVSPGRAYVQGYDIDKTGIEIIDVPKTRETQNIESVNIPFEMGNMIRINNVSGSPLQKGIIDLQSERKNSTETSAGITVGNARVYSFNVTDASYSDSSTNWDLYLYDIQTYTELTLNQSVSSTEVFATSYIKGKNSGASGYAVNAGSGTSVINIRETSGTFSVGEQIYIDGVDTISRTIKSFKVFNGSDIKSVFQSTSVTGFTTAFVADVQLDRVLRPGTLTVTGSDGLSGVASVSSPNTFSGIKTGDIIRYQVPGSTVETYNKVDSIDTSLLTMNVVGVSTVTNVCEGAVAIGTFSGNYSVGASRIRNEEEGYLYAQIPNSNVSTVYLNGSTISFSADSNTTFTTSASGTLTVDTGNFNLGINSTTALFETFDEERYSIFYTDGQIENLTSDKVEIDLVNNRVTFNNIRASESISNIKATFVKQGIQSKVKQYNRSQTLDITLSKDKNSGVGVNTSLNDGLTFSNYYGLRVQDEEISLNYPDVVKIIAVYESLDTSAPVLDKVTFSSLLDVDTNAIIGENIISDTSKTVARIVSKPTTDTLGIVYLNEGTFTTNEEVRFEESGLIGNVSSIINGEYRDISNKFVLDGGQRDQYYDYSRIVREGNQNPPSRRLLVIFDHYTIPDGDTGDVFSVNSYDGERFLSDIPNIGMNEVRASDTLDFRPRVQQFSGSSASPFDFSSRNFASTPKIIVSPNESALIGYDFYLGRIDRLYLDKTGLFKVIQGNPAIAPLPPKNPDGAMLIASINIPPYLYNPSNAGVQMVDNRRYTMRDIGRIEDRVEVLERVTSLSLLELNTQTLQIRDAQGFDRFKSGFFVDDFKNRDFADPLSRIRIDQDNSELNTPLRSNSLSLKPITAQNIADNQIDYTEDYVLLDSNVQKSGEAITLKYESIDWLEQSFATKVENVNPFQVVSYTGTVTLDPSEDSWVRLRRRLPNRSVNGGFFIVGGGGAFRWSIQSVTRDVVVASGAEEFMRSRNVKFSAVNLKPLTRYYQFLDGVSGVDFIPKLVEIANDSTLENYGSSGAFTVGETVVGSFNGENLISFRVANSNHKIGPFNNPTYTFTANPYLSSENIPSSYSASSKTLNIDIASMSEEVQGLYFGYLVKGMKLVGQTSGSVAYVKDLKLVSDFNGFLEGSFFLRNPYVDPQPAVKVETGTKVYKLTSSAINAIPLPGSKLISSGETLYRSQGIWQDRQFVTTTTFVGIYYDPLAQSFSVGGVVQAPGIGTRDDDQDGVFLTAADLFFANKDPGNAPVTVQIRTMELGTPTSVVLGKEVVLNPDQIQTSRDASVATRVTFEYPIYLAPGAEYAIVLLAPQSDQYEVWVAEMGEKTIETAELPDSQAIRYAQQFAIGSLFLSQNGTIWTANQYEDMKFKLYKAKFTSSAGSAFFHNPTLDESNDYVPTLESDPITILPRRVNLGITTLTTDSLVGILTTGRKVSSTGKTYNYGTIVGRGSSVTDVVITDGGSNYTTTNPVSTFAITGNGSGLTLNMTATNGIIDGATPVAFGNGYQVGDVVGIQTSTVSPPAGREARITITGIGTGSDTLYLSNVQGEEFSGTLTYYDNSGTVQTATGISIDSSTPVGGVNDGNYFRINHLNHGMYSSTNKVTISDVIGDIKPAKLQNALLATDTTINIGSASTSNFANFEGQSVPGGYTGYIKIENEIIKYESVGADTLETITRGQDGTIALDYPAGTLVYKYELGGVSLRRINTTHNVSNTDIDIDSHYVEFNRSGSVILPQSNNNENRSADGSTSGTPQLSFNQNLVCGKSIVKSTENIIFNQVNPHVDVLTPGSFTSVGSQIRTVSGTSVSGNEVPFVDQGYENVEIGVENRLTSSRIVCSQINENTHLSSLLRNKSFTLKADLSSTNENLSPIIFWKTSSVEFSSNTLNKPITNYPEDDRVNLIQGDPHAAVYISRPAMLSNPATSLKVIVSAYRHSSADFRVLYSLIRPDSAEVEQSFELFPGYDNLSIDNNTDGFLDVIDESKNSGLPDLEVPASLEDEFLEYEFSANNLPSFTGYRIKIVMSGTDQAYAPRFRDLRTIALA